MRWQFTLASKAAFVPVGVWTPETGALDNGALQGHQLTCTVEAVQVSAAVATKWGIIL